MVHMLEKRKHNLILALFELGTTCSLLKQLVWLFIVLLLTTEMHAHTDGCFICCSEDFCFFMRLRLYIKGFHFADVTTCISLII